MVEIPSLKVCKKVKSMQMFHQSIQSASQGDRLGICVTQFDPSLVERCLMSSPGYLHTSYGIFHCLSMKHLQWLFCVAAIIKVFKIPYFKSECKTGGRFHGKEEYWQD